MLQNFTIDQAASFEWVRFLGCEPKTAFGDPYRQETTKDGVPKWVAQLAARFRQFGRSQNEILNVGLVAEKDPCEGLEPGTPVQLVAFEIGVMPKKNRNGEITGVQVWYRCQEVRPIAATGAGKGRPVEAVS